MLQPNAETAYLDARAADVEAVQAHIADLAHMFGRLNAVVAEQGELVERLEDSTEAALRNVEAGQSQLQRYWQRVSDNRILLVRAVGVLVGAALLFGVAGL